MLALAAALVASAAFAAPITVGQTSTEARVFVTPDPVGGGWVQFETPAGVELTRINEDGVAAPVALPPKLRGQYLELMPLQDGGSGSRKLDVLERQDFGELVEVRIAMEHRNAAVFGGS